MWFICMIFFFPCVIYYVRFFRMDCGYDNSLPQHQMLVFRTEKGDKGERFSWMSPGFFIILIRFSSLIQARCYSLKFSPELWCDCFSLSQFYHLVLLLFTSISWHGNLIGESQYFLSNTNFCPEEISTLSGGNMQISILLEKISRARRLSMISWASFERVCYCQ